MANGKELLFSNNIKIDITNSSKLNSILAFKGTDDIYLYIN